MASDVLLVPRPDRVKYRLAEPVELLTAGGRFCT